jgi:hypothetical protein
MDIEVEVIRVKDSLFWLIYYLWRIVWLGLGLWLLEGERERGRQGERGVITIDRIICKHQRNKRKHKKNKKNHRLYSTIIFPLFL